MTRWSDVKMFKSGDIEVYFLEKEGVLIQKYDVNDYKVEEILIPKEIWEDLKTQIIKEIHDE